MSLHKSLVSKSALSRQRNVLTREERLEKLEREGRWTEENSIFGLPKVAVVKIKKRAKVKEKKTDETEAAAAETTAEDTAEEKKE